MAGATPYFATSTARGDFDLRGPGSGSAGRDLSSGGNPRLRGRRPPTTAGIPDVGVATGTTDYVLSLPNFFQSDVTASTNLAYSIVNNTNPSAFNSLNIDSQGNLTMQFASNASGNATLTVRATDAAGLLVDATVTVHVNEPPVIGEFWAQEGTMDYWTLSGDVSDNSARWPATWSPSGACWPASTSPPPSGPTARS